MSKPKSPPPPTFPPIDLYAIEFPSDTLTFGYARKHDKDEGMGTFSSHDRLTHADRTYDILTVIPLTHEMELAEKAYAKALGIADPHPMTSREELVGELYEEWEKHGLSTGDKVSDVLIEKIEAAAVKQAKAHLGISGPG